MITDNYCKFSLIIACFNESKNIALLFDEIAENQKKISFEIIIVDNGSTDNSKEMIQINKHKLSNFKLINIKENIGFGNGIKMGMLHASNNIICYTHGDLQVKISECLSAYEIYRSNPKPLFIKSSRSNRGVISSIFTKLMGFFNSIFFKTHLYDIHSQPNLFEKPELKVIQNCPNHMGIDLYFYVYFKKKNYLLKRFKISFNKRLYGKGSNELLIDKLRYSLKSLSISLDVKNKLYEVI